MEKFKVYDYKSDGSGDLKLHFLLKDMVYAGIMDTEENNIVFEDERLWVILSWDIKIKRLPVQNQVYNIASWLYMPKGFFVKRNYQVVIDDEVLVEAKALWTTIDKKTREPLRIEDFKIEYKGKTELKDIKSMLKTETDLDGYKIIGKAEAKNDDIDSNLHVNNSVYLKWIYNALPFSQEKADYKNIKVFYIKESLVGERFELYRKDDEFLIVNENKEVKAKIILK